MSAHVHSFLFALLQAVFFFFLSGPAAGQRLSQEMEDKFYEAQAAYNQQDYEKAFPILVEISNSTAHMQTLKMLGDIYLNQKKDYEKSESTYVRLKEMVESKLLTVDAGSEPERYRNLQDLFEYAKTGEQQSILSRKSSSGAVDRHNTTGLLPDNQSGNVWNELGVLKLEAVRDPGASAGKKGKSGGPEPAVAGKAVRERKPGPDELSAEKVKKGKEKAVAEKPGKDKLKPAPEMETHGKGKEEQEGMEVNSPKIMEENGIYTVFDTKLTFKFFLQGQETTWEEYAASGLKGWRLPTPRELTSILGIAKESRDYVNLFEKFAWDKRKQVHLLTNESMIDKNNEQRFRTFQLHKLDYSFEESSVPYRGNTSIILIKD